jgi:hypothetical protein
MACLAPIVASHLVVFAEDGQLAHFKVAGYEVIVTALVAVALLWHL